jgi:hypothetical protein
MVPRCNAQRNLLVRNIQSSTQCRLHIYPLSQICNNRLWLEAGPGQPEKLHEYQCTAKSSWMPAGAIGDQKPAAWSPDKLQPGYKS